MTEIHPEALEKAFVMWWAELRPGIPQTPEDKSEWMKAGSAAITAYLTARREAGFVEVNTRSSRNAIIEECAEAVQQRGEQIAAQSPNALAIIPKAFAIDVAASLRAMKEPT